MNSVAVKILIYVSCYILQEFLGFITLGDSEGQGSLLCCSPGGHRDLDMTVVQRLSNKSPNRKWSTTL